MKIALADKTIKLRHLILLSPHNTKQNIHTINC